MTCEKFRRKRIWSLITARLKIYWVRVCFGFAEAAEKRNIELDGDPGRIVRLRDFHKLKSPFPAVAIRAIAGENYPLLQTLRKLPEDIGEKLWTKCVALT